MGGNDQVNVDGVGTLTYQRAIDVARSTEGNLDPTVRAYLETALSNIWARIQAHPTTYVLTRDEFAVFNFYRDRFPGPVAEQAINRYWRKTGQDPSQARH